MGEVSGEERSYDMQVAVNGVSGQTTRAEKTPLICAPHPETLLKRSKGLFSRILVV